MSKKLKALILAIVLTIISFVFIVIQADTYIVKESNLHGISNVDELQMQIKDESIAQCTDIKIENGVLKATIKSVSKGHTYYDIKTKDDENIKTDSIYVHNFGIITMNEFFGNCNGVQIIPVSIIIWLIYVLYLLIISYRQSVKDNLYQYKNIAYLGLIIFVAGALISQILSISSYMGIINTISGIKNMAGLSFLFLPVTFVVSILVIISNISLIRKEGFSFGNVLGLILGVVLCFATMLPDILYQALYTASWIDVHNQNGWGVYLYDFIEAIINISVTYIECVLAGTIIMGFKAARHVPSFDKDAIMILGCQIKKDGSLTKLLKNRVDRAIEFEKMQKEKTSKEIVFVPSGGKGSDEVISEAQAMKNYLLENGVKEESIIVEDKSKNTFENIKFSNTLINEKIKNAKIAFSTTNYHVLRAGSIATEQGLSIEGIGAKTKSYFWINAFIREFIATLVSEKKKHMATILVIVLVAVLMIVVSYMNNNL